MFANLNVNVDTEDLIWDLLRSLEREELLQFIVDLDAAVCDWEFTEELYKHFKQEHKVYKQEMKEFW